MKGVLFSSVILYCNTLASIEKLYFDSFGMNDIVLGITTAPLRWGGGGRIKLMFQCPDDHDDSFIWVKHSSSNKKQQSDLLFIIPHFSSC